jgi:hypothetical protein
MYLWNTNKTIGSTIKQDSFAIMLMMIFYYFWFDYVLIFDTKHFGNAKTKLKKIK